MKTVRNIILALTLILAAVGLIACGMDDNADEEKVIDTTDTTIVREITTDYVNETRADEDNGVVGDIIDDVETDVENIGDDIETKMKDAKDNVETKMKNAKNKTDN